MNIAAANFNTLQAAALALDTHAHNVANLNTQPFSKARVTFEEIAPQQGAQAALTPIPALPANENNVDLAEEMVGLLNVNRLSEAQVKAIKAQDEMLSAVLDLRA